MDDLAGVADAERPEGGGESIEDRLRGLRTGIDDCPDTLRSGVETGLWWCPTIVSRMLVLAFHRGLFAGLSVTGVIERAVRVGVLAIVRATVGSRYVDGNDFRVVLAPGIVGRLEYRRLGGTDDFVVDVLDWRDFRPAGVTVP